MAVSLFERAAKLSISETADFSEIDNSCVFAGLVEYEVSPITREALISRLRPSPKGMDRGQPTNQRKFRPSAPPQVHFVTT